MNTINIMIVIKKKILIISMLMVCIGIILINNINYKRTYTAQQVSTKTVDEKVVIIDAGHGRRRRRGCF